MEEIRYTYTYRTYLKVRQLCSRNFLLLLAVFFLLTMTSVLMNAVAVKKLMDLMPPTWQEPSPYKLERTALLSTFSYLELFGILGYFFGGCLADKLGRRKTLGYSIALFTLFILLDFLAPSIYWLMLMRLGESYTFSMAFVAIFALIVDISPADTWTTAFGIFGASEAMNIFVFPVVNILVGEPTRATLNFFIFAFFLSLISLAIWLKLFRIDDLKNEIVEEIGSTPEKVKLAKIVFGVVLIVNLAFGILMFVCMLNSDLFKLGWGDIGKYNTTVQVIAFTGFFQVVGGLLADRFGKRTLMLFVCFAIPLMGALYHANSFSHFIWTYGLIHSAANMSSPSYSSMLMDVSSHKKRASILGLRYFFAAFANSIAYLVLGGGVYGDLNRVLLVIPIGLLCLVIPLILMIKETLFFNICPKTSNASFDRNKCMKRWFERNI